MCTTIQAEYLCSAVALGCFQHRSFRRYPLCIESTNATFWRLPQPRLGNVKMVSWLLLWLARNRMTCWVSWVLDTVYPCVSSRLHHSSWRLRFKLLALLMVFNSQAAAISTTLVSVPRQHSHNPVLSLHYPWQSGAFTAVDRTRIIFYHELNAGRARRYFLLSFWS